ncbi:MAG: A1S_2505 family phage non-structural protein, partial [bacterium]
MNNTSIINGRRVASDRIAKLGENEIFVFGSNIQGAHGGGAAWFAHKAFGAEWGVGEGLTGRTYALPTMEGEASLKNA